ncbi:cytochrome P450 [Aspergillus saccharolyticus JOP 1030-1]|uniref:Cytochrome protein n=1 Tax=Aspergillus saccharolyticus JOP 1030-1 TaxID=1450539 RepID=A0A318Z8Y5_9EURO|nr:cytochrome protein [Aspergillus saccharolyticus JOP 1030-1]PYH43736.1 cytochrome protein [Aspergillus saccharolyticus JOP 1030-1]
MDTFLVVVATTGLGLWFFLSIIWRGKLPPGPPPKPIIGNLHQFPKVNRAQAFDQWHRTYGPIVGLKLGLKKLILIGNYQVARELLDRRGAIYSSRPRVVMAGEIANRGNHTALMPYGSKWKLHNRVHSTLMNPRMVQRYQYLQDIESRQLLDDLLKGSTSDFGARIHRYSSSLLFALAYGQRLPTSDAFEIQENAHIAHHFIENLAAGRWLVDAFPVLNYLPTVLAPWKKIGDQLYQRKFGLLQRNTALALEKPGWNWTKHFHGPKKPADASWEELLNIIGVLYEAGADTTTSALEAFVMAAVLHPDPVRRVQAEIDALVGGAARIPNFDDVQQLPYMNAFVNETMRWRPIAPEGVPHSLMEEDEYEGYTLPKNSIVIANQWQMAMDPATFTDPQAFRPERWLEDPKLPISAFGFGRRACPGRHIAMNSMRIVMCRLLWAYDFDHAYEHGQKVPIDPDNFVREGVLSKPAPFKARLRVRSPAHEKTIQSALRESEQDEDKILAHIAEGLA